MTTIYHNPRCSKSREALSIIEQHVSEVKIIKYLDKPLTVGALKKIIKQLGIRPIELVRTGETIWAAHYKGKILSDIDIINAMIDHPKLMERPIVINGAKAVIGRPPALVMDIL